MSIQIYENEKIELLHFHLDFYSNNTYIGNYNRIVELHFQFRVNIISYGHPYNTGIQIKYTTDYDCSNLATIDQTQSSHVPGFSLVYLIKQRLKSAQSQQSGTQCCIPQSALSLWGEEGCCWAYPLSENTGCQIAGTHMCALCWQDDLSIACLTRDDLRWAGCRHPISDVSIDQLNLQSSCLKQ